MNTTSYVALGASLTATAGLAYMIWRFDRRPARQAVQEAERIVENEARRMSRTNHPSMWGRS